MALRRTRKRLRLLAIFICINVSLGILFIPWNTSINESGPCKSGGISIFHNTGKISWCDTERDMQIKYTTDTESFAAKCNPYELYELQLQYHKGNIYTNVPIPLLTGAKCPKNRFKSIPGLPSTALLSYPGAGNTWVRHLLQQMTGLPTGSVFEDWDLWFGAFPFEGTIEDVLVVKTHGIVHKQAPKYKPVQQFDRIILLLRNVYDCFIAEYKRSVLNKGHTGDGYIDSTETKWDVYLEDSVYKWEHFMRDVFNFTGPVLVVFYEDLKTNLLRELVRMAEFLRCDDVRTFSFCCAIKEREGQFHRKSVAFRRDKLFDRNFRILLNGVIQRVAREIFVSFPQEAERLLSYKLPL